MSSTPAKIQEATDNIIAQSTHKYVVFCDISKAFDRVWHSGLLFKIRQLDIRGNLLTWIENCLSNR